MFILITVVILLSTALILLVLQFAAPTFRYNWLIATGGALLGWISVFVWQTKMPIALQFPAWQPVVLFSQSPTFVADGIAWALSCMGVLPFVGLPDSNAETEASYLPSVE